MTTKSTTNIWHQDAETFWPSSTADKVKMIPPAIYRFGTTPDGRWFLTKSADNYMFPYKIYGVNDSILDRVSRAWKGLPGNFGVLLNGLKGTGKTITAQQIVNWAIKEGIMVLNAQSPIPLSMIMEHIEQPMLVLFDEFEKTHDEAQHPGSQQTLLSAIDGLSRNEFRRIFLFTTNTKKVNENLIDRPSRIRYNWEFGRVNSDLIEMLLADLLDPKLSHLRPEILNYLNTRAVLTIDVVKTVIVECNIFREGPEAFKPIMNLTEKEPGAFKVELIDELGMSIEVSSWFKTNQGPWLLSVMSKTGQRAFVEQFVAANRTHVIASTLGQHIEFLGPTEKEDEWWCHVQMPMFKTWVPLKLERFVHGSYLWLDEKPKDWRVPEWARKLEAGKDLTEAEDDALSDWSGSGRVYGGPKQKKVRLKFTLDNSPFSYDPRSFAYGD